MGSVTYHTTVTVAVPSFFLREDCLSSKSSLAVPFASNGVEGIVTNRYFKFGCVLIQSRLDEKGRIASVEGHVSNKVKFAIFIMLYDYSIPFSSSYQWETFKGPTSYTLRPRCKVYNASENVNNDGGFVWPCLGEEISSNEGKLSDSNQFFGFIHCLSVV